MTHRQAVFRIAVALAVAAFASARDARAQAWVGEKGSLDVGLDYNLSDSSEVVDDDGVKVPDAGGVIHQFTLMGEYVPVKHLAVDLSVPLQLLDYTGNKTAYIHPGGGAYDDGNIHGTLTDLRVGAHYQVLEDPVALSPIVAFSFPMANYETVGNMVAGRHLYGLHLGLAAGRQLTDQLYVHLLYEFGLMSKDNQNADTAKYNQDTHDASLLIGYKFLNNKLDINLGANLHITPDGIDFSKFTTYPMDVQLYHDAVLRENMLLVGGGVGYQVTDALNVALAVRVFAWGVNTQNASVYGLALTYNVL